MNSVDKLINFLEKQNFYKDENYVRLKEISKQTINPSNFTETLFIEIAILITSEKKFSEEEYSFLLKFASLSESAKKYFYESMIEVEEKKLLDSIPSRIRESLVIYENKKKEYSSVRSIVHKLKGKKKEIINDNEIKFILDIIKDNFLVKEKTEVLRYINKINTNVLAMHDQSILSEEAISEDDLIETGIGDEAVKQLLTKFGINYSEFPDEYKFKLSKYGNIEKMHSILTFLKNERILGLDFKPYYEIIFKTLLYSSVEMLMEVKNENDISFIELVKTLPSVLYPSTYERKNIRIGGPGGGSLQTSGILKNYVENSKLLKEKGISFEDAWNQCNSFFRNNYKIIRDSVNALESYGISLMDKNKGFRGILSVLGNRNPSIVDVYDLAIEVGAKEYALHNASLLSNYTKFRFELIKYAKKKGLNDSELYKTISRGTPDEKIVLRLNELYEYLNMSPEEGIIEEAYGASSFHIPNKKLFDNIFTISNRISVLPNIYQNNVIKALERFSESDDLYNFNGVKISKRKVLRYYGSLIENGKADSLEALLYCITYRSMLDENELKTIYDVVKSYIPLKDDFNMVIKQNTFDTNGDKIKVIVSGGYNNE